MRLSAVVLKPDAAYMHPRSKFYRNKLPRNFDQTEANKVWASDITYVPAGDQFYYVCVILDLFSRRVLSYNLSDQCNANLVLKPEREAFKNRGEPEGLMFHSDLGLQYASYEFFKLLKKWDIDQSFSRPGNPLDNAVAESFFATYKKEFVTYDDLAVGIAE